MTCFDIIRLKLMTNQSNHRLHFDIHFIQYILFFIFQVGCCQSSRSLALPASCFSPCWWVSQPIRRWRVSRYLHNTRQQQQQLKTFSFFSIEQVHEIDDPVVQVEKGPERLSHHHHHRSPDSCTSIYNNNDGQNLKKKNKISKKKKKKVRFFLFLDCKIV